MSESLDRVRSQLDRYEHPLFDFSVREEGGAIEVVLRTRVPTEIPEYTFTLSERDLNNTQFPWTFQRLLYGCLNDYLAQLFTRSPQIQD